MNSFSPHLRACVFLMMGLVTFGSLVTSRSVAADSIPVIERVLPPVGVEVPAEQREKLKSDVAHLRQRLLALGTNELSPDVEVLIKAVEFALLHDEFYADKKDVAKGIGVLKVAAERIDQLQNGKAFWPTQRGLVARGYRSRIDDSVQPYGLVIPATLDLSRHVPLYVWLHGRGDKATDLHFIHERMNNVGKIAPPNAIVLHPFGRQCVGFKSAGEIDVLDAIEHVASQYKIDRDRIVLIGFSMGGAGAWHVGAHYTDRWCAVSPGAGFAETARYVKLTPDKFPALYEQKLWNCYDVPSYTRNLFNVPVTAYSGEKDPQMQAARIMELAFQEEGETLPHLIGPGVGHDYEPTTLKVLLAKLEDQVARGREVRPRKVSLQTRTLRYSQMYWVEALGLSEHWEDSRIDAEIVAEKKLRVTTKNISSLRLAPFDDMHGVTVEIDGQTPPLHSVSTNRRGVVFERVDAKWQSRETESTLTGLHKKPKLQGPIDDVFLEPFLVVTASRSPASPRVQAWLEFELRHFQERWRAVFRGDLRVKQDIDVTADDLKQFHIVAWGTPTTNALIARLHDKLPCRWSDDSVQIGEQKFPAADHIPVLIYPNPLSPEKYLVLNSGPTFREAHDKTNSQQNPKLPDWAIIDLTQLPSATTPGKIAAAGFFDEQWRVR